MDRVHLIGVFHATMGFAPLMLYSCFNPMEQHIKKLAGTNERWAGNENILFVFIITTIYFGQLIAAFSVNTVASRIGRRDVVMIVKNLVCITGCLCGFFGVFLNVPELFLLTRICTGACKVMCFMQGVFMAECSATRIRGTASAIPQIGFRIWLMSGILFCTPQLGVTYENFHWRFLIPVVPCCIHMLGALLLPRSPKFLYISRNQEEAAIESIKFYQGKEAEIGQILKEYEDEMVHTAETDPAKNVSMDEINGKSMLDESFNLLNGADDEKPVYKDTVFVKNEKPAHLVEHGAVTWKEMFTDARFRWSMTLGIAIFIARPLSAPDLTNFYSVGIITELGVDPSMSAMYVALFMQLPSLILSITSTSQVDRLGRRFVCFTGFAVSIIGCILLFISGLVPAGPAPYLGVVGLLGCLCGVAIGPALISSFICGELCLHSVRMRVFGLSTVIDNLTGIGVVTLYPLFSSYIGTFAVVPLIVLCILDFCFLYRYLPETKGNTVGEINHKWNTVGPIHVQPTKTK